MKIIFLGTNGWYDTETGNTTCILIETEKEFIILDAGNGLYKIDKYIRSKKPIYLFLSHFHLDHIIGLHMLCKFNFEKGLGIYGPKGTKNILKKIIAPPFSMPLNSMPYHVTVNELPQALPQIPVGVKVKELRHSTLTLGYRFELDAKIIAYVPDTGYCEAAVSLAGKADMLIAECAFKSGQDDENWPHLNPESAAKIASLAKAQKLLLVHFDANNYKKIEERMKAEKAARKIFANSFAALDNMEIAF